MSTLAEIRNRLYAQLDVEADDFGTDVDGGEDLIYEYVREAFYRTMAAESRWPFFEAAWEATLAEGETSFTMPSSTTLSVAASPAYIESMKNRGTGKYLKQVSERMAEQYFAGMTSTASDPDMYSVWGSTVTLWPTPTAEARTYDIRGYREPVWTGVAADELDGDVRLHRPMFHYACSLAYAQLEDPELEAQYLQRWAQGLNDIRSEIMKPTKYAQPLILNGGIDAYRRDAVGRTVWSFFT